MVVGLLHEHVNKSGYMQQLGLITTQVQLRDFFAVAGAIDGKQFSSGTNLSPPILNKTPSQYHRRSVEHRFLKLNHHAARDQ
jgi:hypothetical protein